MKTKTLRKSLLDPLNKIEQFDFTNPEIDTRSLVDGYHQMGFVAHDLAKACRIYSTMLNDPNTTILFAVAGSTSGAGCAKIYRDLVRYNMLDMFVSNGATPVDMHLAIEELKSGSGHMNINKNSIDDKKLFDAEIDRLYTAVSDNKSLTTCDDLFTTIAVNSGGGVFSSMEYLNLAGKYLSSQNDLLKKTSLLGLAYQHHVPVLLPAFADCSAGIGTMMHNRLLPHADSARVTIDTMLDLEYSAKMILENARQGKKTGVVIIGGGVPKNWVQDLIIAAQRYNEDSGNPVDVPMHTYVIQISLALEQDGGCSGSTLSEAMSWGKVDANSGDNTVMVFAEASSILPVMANYGFRTMFTKREARKLYKASFQ